MSRALIIVDVQNDFCEGGSLEVVGGAQVASDITDYVASHDREYGTIVFTKDWHIDPGDHFASSSDKEPDYIDDWPDHCVADTPGAELHPNLVLPPRAVEFRKGQYSASYTGFDGKNLNNEELGWFLNLKGVHEVDVCGLALDYCVRATALDAVHRNFGTNMLCDLTAAVANERFGEVCMELNEAGVGVV